jgi:hypothetical protein
MQVLRKIAQIIDNKKRIAGPQRDKQRDVNGLTTLYIGKIGVQQHSQRLKPRAHKEVFDETYRVPRCPESGP